MVTRHLVTAEQLERMGEHTLVVTGDLVGSCDPGPNCTETGNYTYTATNITIDPGLVDEVTFAYTIQGTTLTLTGTIDTTPVTIVFTKA